MPNNTEDTQANSAAGAAEPVEGAADVQFPAVAGIGTVAVPRVEAPDDREVRRAKRAEAKAKKRADAAAKKASLAYAEVAAALRNLEQAAQKVPASGASAAAPAAAPAAASSAEKAAAPAEGAPAAAEATVASPAEAAPAAAPAAAAEAAAVPSATAAPAAVPAPAADAAPAAVATAPAASVAVPAASAAGIAAPAAVAAPAAATSPVPSAPAVNVAAAAPVPVAPAADAAAAAVPVAAPMPQVAGVAAAAPAGYPMPGQPYVVVEARRGHGRAIVLTLVGVVVAAGLVAAGVFAYQQLVAPKPQPAEDVPTAVGPVANSTGIPMSKVSLRANAEGWSVEESTPVVAHVQRVAGSSSSSSSSSAPFTSQARATSASAPVRQVADGSSSSSSSDAAASGSAGYDAYHAFNANESTTLELVPGRYTFTYLTPLNSDGSLYDVPEPMEVTVGDDGTALLPVNLTRVAADDVTKERAEQVIAALKTAMARGDGSFSNAAFKSAYDKAFSEWFAPKEDEEVELTEEERARLESQLASSSSSASSSNASAHDHVWTAVTENRVVNYTETVVESPAWQEPIYDARGNIIGYNYHPAITRNEAQQRTERVITGYRCSTCGAVVDAL